MIHVGDCLEVMRALEANSFDSIVTDPPYHLTTGKKGGTGAASDNPNSPAGRSRIGTGFMGKAWDGGDVAQRAETWAAVLRVAKPGAWLAAFSGTRTSHRMVCAIEDAGWEIRDTAMWVYGSGFPKSYNGEWGGTALKPAWEPITLARKPLEGTVEANWRKWGTGALNIDGCRVPVEDEAYARNCSGDRGHAGTRDHEQRGATDLKPGGASANAAGRWPANVIHDGSDEVLALFPQAPGQMARARNDGEAQSNSTFGALRHVTKAPEPRSDTGSAARFFYCAKASRADRNDGCDGMEARPLLWSSGTQSPGTFQAEGTRRASENNHPTVKPTDLMRWLCRLVTPPGGRILDPFAGSGSTGRGAVADGFAFEGIELDPAYAAIALARIRAMQPGLALGPLTMNGGLPA
ncbi:DNA methyltransferase [Luteimonas saliphila]|uniref:DNA methyltransferase n=1 Tax=Luteimonas saliphila TaxID=2804919 RepID=UPI00192DA475|nr:DNA methyltransferase [Luteimonas saliphila]